MAAGARRWEWRFEPSPQAAADLRRRVRATLASRRIPYDAALLVASELATNAVVHAGTALVVGFEVHRTTLRVEVRDGAPTALLAGAAAADAESGRGLGIVAACATAWGVTHDATGKVVWAELPREDWAGAASASGAA